MGPGSPNYDALERQEENLRRRRLGVSGAIGAVVTPLERRLSAPVPCGTAGSPSASVSSLR